MVLDVVIKTYVLTLHNVCKGYMVSSTKYIMNNIIYLYRNINVADIKMKEKLLQ